MNEPDLSGTDGDLYGMELLYNEGLSALNGLAQYNGNISGMKWKSISAGSAQKAYGFSYDQVNRLLNAKYAEGTAYNQNTDRYNEGMTYDKNGNIQSVTRKGQTSSGVFGNLDVLTYSYTGMGNQVRAIGDAVTDVAGRGDFYDFTDGNTSKEYYYDRNGNMKLDKNKHFKIEYNLLNLPARIIDTINTTLKTEYVYTTGGQKIKERLSTGKTLLYNGNIVYTLDGTANGITVQYILTPEGRVTYASGTFTYEYYIKDHLGSIRLAFNVPASAAVIVQTDDYYPFGMLHKPQTANNDNKYLYNGKELQDDMNLNWYDYGARFYDPQIGRWHVQDPMAELYFSMTQYCYAENNPIALIDPDGQRVVNRHEEERERAREAKRNAEARFTAANKEINKKDWRQARRELNKTGRALNRAESNYQSIQTAITALQTIAPDIFYELDNLQDPYEQNIDISVSVLESNETYWVDGDQRELLGGTYFRPGSGAPGSYILDPISGSRNTIGVKLKSGAGPKIFAHEGGHCVYFSRNVREYFFILLAQNPTWVTHKGHAPGDPTGIAADQMERRFLVAYRMYLKQLRHERQNNR